MLRSHQFTQIQRFPANSARRCSFDTSPQLSRKFDKSLSSPTTFSLSLHQGQKFCPHGHGADTRDFKQRRLKGRLRRSSDSLRTRESISTFPAVVAQLSTGSALCSHSPMFPQPYVPTFLRIFYSLTILTIRPYVPTALCSHRSMFPDLF